MSFPENMAYRAPVWLPGGHLQTIYSSLFIHVPPMAYRRELLGELAPLVTTLEGHPWGALATGRTPREAEHSRWAANRDLSFVPLRPERVVEVGYDHLEGDRFRHVAQMLRWRPDRDPLSCRYDQLDEPVSYDLAEVLSVR